MDEGSSARARLTTWPSSGTAGERLQNLGEIGFHSLALTGSEDDDSELHEPASLAGQRRNCLPVAL